MNMKSFRIAFEDLYAQVLSSNPSIVEHKDYEVLECKNIDIKTIGNKYVPLKYLSRHKTEKDMIEVTVKANDLIRCVTVTTDHICMIYNRDHFFESTNAKNLNVGQIVSIYDEQNDCEVVGEISEIKNLGKTDEWVYDCEVEDDEHCFYANDILVHNSQFVDLQCVSKDMIRKYGLPEYIEDWPQEKRQELWDIVSNFTNTEINTYVRNLVHEYCKTNHQQVLTYELEYMASSALYESKKHYFVQKIFDEGDAVFKSKVTGIELKKSQVDKSMKTFLQDIYEGVVIHRWKMVDYEKYVNELYDRFKTFNVDQISFWKGYNTERQAVGFLQMAVGTTGIAKACNYYNQILEKEGLGKKYDMIQLGDKVRQLYIKPSNKYGIDVLAYKPSQWPKEFDKIFEIDYMKMFQKIILDPLKRFREACQFEDTDPTKQVVQDVFDL